MHYKIGLNVLDFTNICPNIRLTVWSTKCLDSRALPAEGAYSAPSHP